MLNQNGAEDQNQSFQHLEECVDVVVDFEEIDACQLRAMIYLNTKRHDSQRGCRDCRDSI